MSRMMKNLAVMTMLCLFALPMYAETAADKVDINSATLESLTTLPRIGPKIAQRVLDYRAESGGFNTVEELMNVRGIGPKVFDEIKDRIIAGPTVRKADPKSDTSAKEQGK